MSTFGGGPVGLSLNNYRYRDGRPIEMLVNAPSATPELTFAGGTFSASKVHYNCNLAPGKYEATASPLTVSYSYRNAEGGELIKRYTFHPNHYDYDLVVDVSAPLPGLIKRRAASMIMGTALKELKKEAER